MTLLSTLLSEVDFKITIDICTKTLITRKPVIGVPVLVPIICFCNSRKIVSQSVLMHELAAASRPTMIIKTCLLTIQLNLLLSIHQFSIDRWMLSSA